MSVYEVLLVWREMSGEVFRAGNQVVKKREIVRVSGVSESVAVKRKNVSEEVGEVVMELATVARPTS